MTYTPEELAAILTTHTAWLRDEPKGQRANLSGANLYGANLYGYISIGPIGSRYSYLWARWEDKGYTVHTGCFQGTLSEFESKVEETHNTGIHREEYLAAIALLKIRAKETEKAYLVAETQLSKSA